MRHARPDYQRIQDPSGLIPQDEPVFLIRGQDKYAAMAVRHYARLVAAAGAPLNLVEACFAQADAMDAWPIKKTPDL